MRVSHKQWHRNGAIPSEAGCETLSRPVPNDGYLSPYVDELMERLEK
jgi:hypothetical protein